jgi:hypothetical protein
VARKYTPADLHMPAHSFVMEKDTDSDDDAPAVAHSPCLVEDAATQRRWVECDEQLAQLVRSALLRRSQVAPTGSTRGDRERPDVLAQARGMQVFRRAGSSENELFACSVPRRGGIRALLLLPQHGGAAENLGPAMGDALAVDSRAERTLLSLLHPHGGARKIDSPDAIAGRAVVGVVYVQGDVPSEWHRAREEQRQAILDYATLLAVTRDTVQYTFPLVAEHMVTYAPEDERNGAMYQVFRAPDYSTWIAVVLRGHTHPRSLRRVVIGPPHTVQ